jgi:hypothetical protein
MTFNPVLNINEVNLMVSLVNIQGVSGGTVNIL